MDQVGPMTYDVFVSPVFECIIGIDIRGKWEKSHIGYQILELSSPLYNPGYQKQHCISEGLAETNATIKALKETTWMILSHPLLIQLFDSCGCQMGLGE